jgi:hypothetical protein
MGPRARPCDHLGRLLAPLRISPAKEPYVTS